MTFNTPTVVGMAVLAVIYFGLGALWVRQRGWRMGHWLLFRSIRPQYDDYPNKYLQTKVATDFAGFQFISWFPILAIYTLLLLTKSAFSTMFTPIGKLARALAR